MSRRGAGSAPRSAGPDLLILDIATIAAGFGVSIVQVGLPPIVRDWLPPRIPLALCTLLLASLAPTFDLRSSKDWHVPVER